MKLDINEKETPNIEVKNKGILEVPEGKNVDDLPLSHFEKLAKEKGLSKITKALNNLQVWNKNDDKKLSKWASDMIDKLNKKLGKEESIMKLTIKESNESLVKESLYNIIYDYDDEEGNTYTNEELFKGSWTELQNLIKKMKSNGCYHIDANAISEEEDFYESLINEDSKKSYWKFNQFEKDDYEYYDKQSVRKFNLIPCETEDDCFVDENDNYSAWPVYDISDGDSTKPVFCTKREAYDYLLDLLNQSIYEREHDI